MQETQAPVQELKRPMPFGALVGNSTSGRQTDYFGGFSNEQVHAQKSEQYFLLKCSFKILNICLLMYCFLLHCCDELHIVHP